MVQYAYGTRNTTGLLALLDVPEPGSTATTDLASYGTTRCCQASFDARRAWYEDCVRALGEARQRDFCTFFLAKVRGGPCRLGRGEYLLSN